MVTGFENASRPPSLHAGEVHLWTVPLALERSYAELPTADERARVRRLVAVAAKARFAAARTALRVVLGGYARVEPASLTIAASAHGKPFLKDLAWLRFSLAHSDELALVGVARSVEVGVDVERRRVVADAMTLAARYLAPEEARALARLPVAAQADGFLRCWTLKEAMLKATGEGLSRALDSFRILIGPDEFPRLLDLPSGLGASASWSLRELEPAPGYLGAVAVQSHACHLRCFTLRI